MSSVSRHSNARKEVSLVCSIISLARGTTGAIYPLEMGTHERFNGGFYTGIRV